MFLLSERIFFYHFRTKLPSLWLHVPWTIQIQIWNSWGLWVHGHISQGGVSPLFYWQVFFLVPEQHSPSVPWIYEKVDILQVFFYSEGDIASVGKRSSVRPPSCPGPGCRPLIPAWVKLLKPKHKSMWTVSPSELKHLRCISCPLTSLESLVFSDFDA